MDQLIFRYVYHILGGVCIVSGLLWIGMHGVVPLHTTYAGTGLVLSTSAAELTVGERGTFYAPADKSTVVASVAGSVRMAGELQYYSADAQGVVQTYFPANMLLGRTVATIPLLGVLVRLLTHPVGLMALMGMPLVMFAADLLLPLLVRVRTRYVARGEHVAVVEPMPTQPSYTLYV